jgi:hypothetical protein
MNYLALRVLWIVARGLLDIQNILNAIETGTGRGMGVIGSERQPPGACLALIGAGLSLCLVLAGIVEWSGRIASWGFWLLAVLMSLFYGLAARAIFQIPDTRAYQGWVPPWVLWPWKVHQFWFNFVGSFIGWATGYYLVIQHLHILDRSYPLRIEIGLVDMLVLLTAALGTTGYLPYTLARITEGISALAAIVVKR